MSDFYFVAVLAIMIWSSFRDLNFISKDPETSSGWRAVDFVLNFISKGPETSSGWRAETSSGWRVQYFKTKNIL